LFHSNYVKIGTRVLILLPPYVAGKVGVVCHREVLAEDQPSQRWLIQVKAENILVSLTQEEFQVLN
jgi:hypothetical protein